MSNYDRMFCQTCKTFTVHEDEKCVHHDDLCANELCKSPIKFKDGYFHFGKKNYCCDCGPTICKPESFML